MSIKDKPAFPTVLDDGCSWTQGMTLRDYFAAKALQGICAHPDTWGIQTPLIIAKECYTLADAMLEARNK